MTCPVCEGSGIVTLGAAALALHEPATVARSVELAIEAESRRIEEETTLSDNRSDMLRQSVAMLSKAGLMAAPKPSRAKRPRHLVAVPDLPAADPVAVAAEFAPVEPIDETLADAAPYIYEVTERPNVRGLPSLSAAGHPSSTARIADVMPVGTDTGAVARQRHNQDRAALVLVKAAPLAASIKERRERKAA